MRKSLSAEVDHVALAATSNGVVAFYISRVALVAECSDDE